jgi:uncharacterized membrane protein HdeD (DUF308 family)
MSGWPLHDDEVPVAPARRRYTPRFLAETTAIVLIAGGVFMLMQPFSLTLYSWSFLVMLVGTVLFIVGSKFPG